ncbi:hypothetical protein VCHA53O466_140212 [Vibrio chagasii]|nr:hypothetical protein VCHA53O466_140212 [Vibrio chagasii]
MMKTNPSKYIGGSKKGFTIIELIVASGLFASAIVMKERLVADSMTIDSVNELSTELTEIVKAMDSRVRVDGDALYGGQASGWNERWLDTEGVLTEMLPSEFISNGNDICGVQGSWDAPSGFEGTALIGCEMLTNQTLLSDLNISSERFGKDGHVNSLKLWTLDVHFRGDQDFRKITHPEILLSRIALDMPPLTSINVSYEYIDDSTGESVESRSCFVKGATALSCTLRFSVEPIVSIGDAPSYYLVDGSLTYKSSMNFFVGQAPLKCMRTIEDGLTVREVDVSCGVDTLDGEVNTFTHTSLAQRYDISDVSAVSCLNIDGEWDFCGLHVSERGEAVAAANSVTLSESFSVVNDLGEQVFTFDSSGNATSHVDVNVTGDVSVGGSLSVSDTLSNTRTFTVNNQSADQNLQAMFVGGANGAGLGADLKTVTTNYILGATRSVGETCSEPNLAATNTGAIVFCDTGAGVYQNTELPQNAIVSMIQGGCPIGYTLATGADGRTLSGTTDANAAANLSHTGVTSITLAEGHLPAHGHSHYRTNRGGNRRRNSSTTGWGGNYAANMGAAGHANPAGLENTPRSVGVTFCKKD